jgi:hypothetical protein
MSTQPYKFGTTIRIPCTCERLNSAGAYEYFDPPTVSIIIKAAKAPAAVSLTNIIRVSVGSYYADYLPTIDGDYVYQGSFAGDVAGCNDGVFKVAPPRI